MTTTEIPSLNKFWKMLSNHDWTFNYSDDHSVWRRGTAQLSEIQEVVEAGGEKYKKLFEEYSNYAWRKDDSIKQPTRPPATKEDQINDRELLFKLAEAIEHIKDEIWQIDSDQITSSDQLWKLLYPAQSIIHKVRDIIEDKSKSTMWDTKAFSGYRRIKEDLES